MISHVYVGTSNFSESVRFYSMVLAVIGLKEKFCDKANELAGWMKPGHERPLFLVGRPYDGMSHHPGNGQMVALLAPSREAVDLCYQSAIEQGAVCAGVPGLRPQYHENYYGAYFRDLDRNKICICCHSP